MNTEKKSVVASKSSNTLYRFNGDTNFTNLKTGVTGDIEIDKAKVLFKVPVELNIVVLKFPNVLKLLEVLSGTVTVESENGIKTYNV